MTNIQLLPAKDYLRDLQREITHAKKRIVIMSIVIADDRLTHSIFEALKAAARRGVEVTIAADSFTFSELGGYFSPFKRLHRRSQQSITLAKELQATGVSFHWLGSALKLNPFAGNAHIKWSIVDTTVYSFGGVNLWQEGIESTDYLIKIRHPQLAQQLANEHQEIIEANVGGPAYESLFKPLAFGTVYTDSGQPGDSAIYRRACELASVAKTITYVSQYCPSGHLAKILKQKQASIYFNQPENCRNFFVRQFVRFASLTSGIASLYTRKAYLHAKFILFEMPSGQKIALTGSHNFAYRGVAYGTREVALETSDKEIYLQLEKFLKKAIV